MAILKIAKNFLSITALQAMNYLVPLLVLPFVVQKVGIANFGLSNYTLACFITLKVLMDYGYSISGVKDIAEAQGNKDILNQIFSRILFTKIYILIVVIVLLTACVLLVPIFRQYALLISFSFLIVIGQSIMPTWFFQGMEKSEILIVFSLATRALYLYFIFKYISKPADYVYLNLFLGIADVALSLLSYAFIFGKFKIKLQVFSRKQFYKEIRSNFEFAKANVLVSITLSIPFLALGFFSDKVLLGYYSIADKILQILRTSASILHGATFPRVIQLFQQSFDEFKSIVKKIQLLILVFYFIAFIICFFFPSFLIGIITNDIVHNETVMVLKIFSVAPMIAALEILPTQLLIISHKQDTYVRILAITCVVSLIASVAMAAFLGFIGTACCYVFVEFFLLVSLMFHSRVALRKIL